MADIPQTSITLLNALATSTANDQWYRFYDTYKGPVFAYVQANFPELDPDTVFQDTLIALTSCLPTYRYTPDQRGHFHNYLIGIAKHKALDILRKQKREMVKIEKFSKDPLYPSAEPTRDFDDAEWEAQKKAILETALEQLLADENISATTRSVFEQVVLQHEDAANVAARFGTTRNNVYQIKNRLMDRLMEIAQALEAGLEN